MHPNYLSAYIRQHTGITYKELVQTQRLSQAAKLLRSTALSTNDISLAVGYQNTSFSFSCSARNTDVRLWNIETCFMLLIRQICDMYIICHIETFPVKLL